MNIKKGQIINYGNETWNIQVSYQNCNITNKRLLSVRNNGSQIIDVICRDENIEAVILFDARETPVKLIGIPENFNNVSILICNTRNRIALYINDTLQDEDWQLGKSLLDGSGCDLSLGDWSISGDFSIAQSYPDHRDTITKIQNWKPDGHNTGVGDCMPFYHEGTFHLFYLFDRRSHGSKWGLGAHQWAHLSTKDLKNWTEHPMALSIDEQYEGSICTGSVIFHNGIYYAFYAVRMSDGSPARLTWATSEDCIYFVKSNKYYELDLPYDSKSARDPMVIIGEDGIAHMFVTTSIDKRQGKRGCLAHLTSPDLQNWTPADPLIILDMEDQPECSDYFFYNGWYYLIYSNYGTAKYFMSREPFGPWKSPKNNIVINSVCRVPKTAKFGKNRILAAGFITPPDRWYAGRVVFNELIQNSDGTFQFIVPKELE